MSPEEEKSDSFWPHFFAKIFRNSTDAFDDEGNSFGGVVNGPGVVDQKLKQYVDDILRIGIF